MKKYLIVFASVAIVFGCANSEQSEMTEAEETQLLNENEPSEDISDSLVWLLDHIADNVENEFDPTIFDDKLSAWNGQSFELANLRITNIDENADQDDHSTVYLQYFYFERRSEENQQNVAFTDINMHFELGNEACNKLKIDDSITVKADLNWEKDILNGMISGVRTDNSMLNRFVIYTIPVKNVEIVE